MEHVASPSKQEEKVEKSCLGSGRGSVGENKALEALEILLKLKDRCRRNK